MKSRRTKAVIVGAAGASLAVLLCGFFLFAAIVTRSVSDHQLRADGIVVLTGGEARIAEAGRLLATGQAKRLLVSGVNRRTSQEELRRLTGLKPHTFDCCVDIGYAALDTFGNADEARAWVNRWQYSSLIVVTASYHMPRALAEFALVLPQTTLMPHAVVPRRLRGAPWWLRLDAARTLVSEYIKFLPVATRFAVARLIGNREQAVVADVLRPAAGASTIAGRL